MPMGYRMDDADVTGRATARPHSAGALGRLLLLALLGLCAGAVQAANCDEQHWQGQRPVLVNPKLSVQTQPLCKQGFEVLHSGVTRTALWSAEHLTRQRIRAARTLDRQGTFFEDPALPVRARATLADYRGSGFDRGHLAPNGDMATRGQQADSFSLANMVPQNPQLNRGAWSEMEQAVRALVAQEGEAYVLTGPAYRGAKVQRIGQVLVPTELWKAVYFPQRQAASAYWTPNDAQGAMEVISVAELERRTGIRVWPGLAERVRQQRVDLPLGTAHRGPRQTPGTPPNESAAEPKGGPSSPDWWSVLRQLLQNVLKAH